MPPRTSAEPPIVFLAITSSEVGRWRDLPELEQEYKQLQAIYEAAARAGRCELVPRFAVTLSDIFQVFRAYDSRIQVLHFAGHADSESLVLQDDTGKVLPAGAAGFASFLASHPGLRLLFLNGCYTQEQIGAFHAAGVPVVIATRDEVDDERALKLSVHFHAELSSGSTVAAAFAAAQAAMQAATFADPQPWDPGLWVLSAPDASDAQWRLGERWLGEIPWRVPFLRNPSFVGREADLHNLHTALADSSAVGIRPAGLTGMGGIGKTQLAVEYCYRCKESYPGGVFWLNAAADWCEEFAGLGAYLEPDLAGEPLDRRVLAAAGYLKAHKDCLVVLDNTADPAQTRQAVTPDLIPADLPCRLLLTTRRRDLGAMRGIEVTVLPEAPALQLLLHGEGRKAVLAPTHAEHGDACAVYRMLGGLPLALEVAGAYLAEYGDVTLGGFRQRLHREGRLAALDAIGGDPLLAADLRGIHAAAVAATLGEQWDALGTGKPVDEDARLLLRVAGQMPEAAQIPAALLGLLGGLVLEAAPGEPGRAGAALRRLERASLVETLEAGVLRLHPLVREYAEAKTEPEDRAPFRQACAGKLLAAYRQVVVLERQCARRGVEALEADLQTALALLPPASQAHAELPAPKPAGRLAAFVRRLLRLGAAAQGESGADPRAELLGLLRMLQNEAHNLRDWDPVQQPQHFWQQWRKRALISGDAQQAAAAAAGLAGLTAPHLFLQWSTAHDAAGLEHTLSGHTDQVTAVAVTADGLRAVSASDDDTLRVWDLQSGRDLHTLSGHRGGVTAVAVTADGRRAVSASGDHTLKVWDLQSGRDLHTLSGHPYWVTAVAVTAGGLHAVSASYDDATLKVWDLQSGRELHTLNGHTDGVNAIAVTADGLRAVSASDDDTLRVWDPQSGRALQTLRGHTNWVHTVAVTADGLRAVSASDGTLKVWDIQSGRELQTLRGHAGGVRAVAVTVDGRRAVSASNDHTLKVWDLLQSGRDLHMLRGHRGGVNAIAVTADGRRAVSASYDDTLKVWDLQSGRDLHTLSGHTDGVSTVAVTADGRRAVSASDDTLKVWDLQSGRDLHTLSGHTNRVNAVVVTADGRRAVSASDDHTLKVWDLQSGRELHTLSGHRGWVHAVGVTADGLRAISASGDATLKVWDLQSGRELHTLSGHKNGVNAIAVTADGRRAVSASYDHTLKVWDLQSGRELHTLSGHTNWVHTVAVTADGRRAVSASDDRTLKVWDLQSGRELHTLSGHTRGMSAVVVTADGLHAVSSSGDATLKVWDLGTAQLLTSIAMDATIRCVIVSGIAAIVAGDESGNVHYLHYSDAQSERGGWHGQP